MLVVETVARIRREFFVNGKSIKEIVRALGVSRNTVRKVVRSGETAFSDAVREGGNHPISLIRANSRSLLQWRWWT